MTRHSSLRGWVNFALHPAKGMTPRKGIFATLLAFELRGSGAYRGPPGSGWRLTAATGTPLDLVYAADDVEGRLYKPCNINEIDSHFP
jgi:hypothetical protein